MRVHLTYADANADVHADEGMPVILTAQHNERQTHKACPRVWPTSVTSVYEALSY